MKIRRSMLTLTLAGALAFTGVACEDEGSGDTEDVTPELGENEGEGEGEGGTTTG